MPTGRPFSNRVSLQPIVAATNSVGAHISAKLEEFLTDERTLTDELCDMLCIWSQLPPDLGLIPTAELSLLSALPSVSFDLNLRKTTAPEETRTGADLKLALTTPLGTKTALFQAKVFDAGTDSLRGNKRAQLDKLRTQLRDARARAGDLAFLLLYVPASLLRADAQGYSTWEQGFRTRADPMGRSPKFGAMLFPVDDLLDARNRWRSRDPVKRISPRVNVPAPLSFTDLFLEMLSCRRGRWSRTPTRHDADEVASEGGSAAELAFRSLGIGVSEVAEIRFEDFAARVRAVIDDRAPPRGAG